MDAEFEWIFKETEVVEARFYGMVNTQPAK